MLAKCASNQKLLPVWWTTVENLKVPGYVCIQTKLGHLTGLLSLSQYANAGGQPTN